MSNQPAELAGPGALHIGLRHRISTGLFVALAFVAVLILSGLLLVGIQLNDVRTEIQTLNQQSLPRLIKLSQLAQEASASIAIAPALSTNPTRYEFETLLSRIKDKAGSQEVLIAEISALITDPDAVRALKANSSLLAENQTNLTGVVRRQIDVRGQLEEYVETLRKMARELSRQKNAPAPRDEIDLQAAVNIHKLIGTLLDPNRARFSRNRREVEEGLDALGVMIADDGEDPDAAVSDVAARFWAYWLEHQQDVFGIKSEQLANEFRIKALVEENSLIANRLLSNASNEFASASGELTGRTELVSRATRSNLIVMAITIVIVAAGSLGLWLILKARVLRRLDNIRVALQAYAKGRSRTVADPSEDEIGDISRALSGYMDEIDGREVELSEQTKSLQQLSAKLSKYLSPQVYDSIFSGRQDVKVSSTRKKLTVFFSDIVGFTDAADRMESEELTSLLNNYLTEMTQIALDHGATIDKYIGDAIMVFFGDPETRGVKEDALACVNMAIAMRDRLQQLAYDWRNTGIEIPLNCRAGIHTGYCTVGNFGSESRMDYTIIGGPVNLASRLESAAEPGQILISYETFAHVQDEIECKEVGRITVKGISHEVATYLVVGKKERLAERIRESRGGLSVDIDLGALTGPERQEAERMLERALALVRNDDGKPGG